MTIKSVVEQICRNAYSRDPFEIARQHGIILTFEPLGTIRGYYSKSHGFKMIHINEDLNEHQANCTCSHELGHAFMHPDLNTPFLYANTLFSVNKYEVEANRFMTFLLVPPEDIQEWIFSQYTVEQMARMTGLTPELVEYVIDEYIEDGDVELPSEEW